ncbi:MAG: hypothetical protein JST11_01160 [Acidobacteria bacterium]|nr:hypothetical protein [Acidobacteriota bacterium]
MPRRRLAGPAPVTRALSAGAIPGQEERIFFLANVRNPPALQEVVNVVRSIAEVQRFFPLNQAFAIAVRGTAAQAELSEWLIGRLDTAGAPLEGEYPASGFGVVRVFAVAETASAQAIQDTVNRIRTEAQAQRVFPATARHAIVFRGTAAQAGVAERLVGNLNGAAR